MRHWVLPSERFVADVLRSTTATDAPGWRTAARPHPPAGAFTREAPAPSAALGDPAGPGVLAALLWARAGGVLHSHFGQPAQLTCRAARRLGRPFGVSLHGYDLLVESPADPAMLEAVRAADLVVVPSQFLADAAAERGVREEVIRVIPSGVDLAEFPFRERRAPPPRPLATVTFAGRFAPKKGVLDAARVLAEVAQQPELPAFRRLRRAEPWSCAPAGEQRPALAGAEILYGRAPGAVRRALEETDVLLTPSRTAADGDAETLGHLNLEAQAMGVPVVTTSHGAIPEAVSPAGGARAGSRPCRPRKGAAMRAGCAPAVAGDGTGRPGSRRRTVRAGGPHRRPGGAVALARRRGEPPADPPARRERAPGERRHGDP